MTGWNMPPGCNERDIPGNTPEEEAYEKFIEQLAEVAGCEFPDKLYEWLWERMGQSFTEGYNMGVDDRIYAAEIFPKKD